MRLERVSRGLSRGRLWLALVALAVMLSFAWDKPLDSPQRMTIVALPSSPPPAKPTASPTVTKRLLAFDRRQCPLTDDWRLVSAELTATGDTRTMYGVAPAPASGPGDPAVPVSQLHASALKAVGICVPWSPMITPTDELNAVVLWQVATNGESREVMRPVILDESLYELGEAYFGPPADEPELWPAGRYVFQIRRLAGGDSRWLGIEFIPTFADGNAR